MNHGDLLTFQNFIKVSFIALFADIPKDLPVTILTQKSFKRPAAAAHTAITQSCSLSNAHVGFGDIIPWGPKRVIFPESLDFVPKVAFFHVDIFVSGSRKESDFPSPPCSPRPASPPGGW